MKRYLSFALIFFLLAFNYVNAFAQTVVEGTVSGQWIVSKSPYHVVGDLEIPSDSLLIIEDGVKVIFEGNYSFTVYGRLNAVGDADSIFFTSVDASTQWLGIYFDTEQNHNPLPIPSIIEYCHFENVKKPGPYAENGAVKVSNHNIQSIKHCTFQNCELGITLITKSPVATISDCKFIGTFGEHAIKLSTNQRIDSLKLLNNSFTSSLKNSVVIKNNSLTLKAVRVFNNCFSNLESEPSNCGILITGNTSMTKAEFVDNRFNNIYKNYIDSSAITFLSNKPDMVLEFSNNQVQNCGSDSAFSGALYIDNCQTVEFNLNKFENNKGVTAGAVYLHANEFISVQDTFHYNSSVKISDSTGNGGAVYYRDLGINGKVKFSHANFKGNQADNFGGSVYINVLNSLDTVEFNNSFFDSEESRASGGVLAVLFSGNVEYAGFFNNTFKENKSRLFGGCIYFYSRYNNKILRLESVANNVTGGGQEDNIESYIYYSGYGLPGHIYFKNDSISAINYSVTNYEYDRTIHFLDRASQYHQDSTKIELIDLTSSNCNRGLFNFNANHEISDISMEDCRFENIDALVQSVMFVQAAWIGNVSIQGSQMNSISSQSNGGAMCLLSKTDITNILIKPGAQVRSEFIGCSVDSTSGSVLYADADGVIENITIEETIIENCDAPLNGGIFYFNSADSYSSGSNQSLTMIGNDVNLVEGVTSCEGSGGLIYYNSYSVLDSLLILDNQLFNISAKESGGAFALLAEDFGPAFIRNNSFQNIYTSGEGSNGGVLFISSANDIEGLFIKPSEQTDTNRFVNCHSAGSGGCLYADAEGSVGDVIIENVHLANCYADFDGGGFFILSSDDASLANNLSIYNNICNGNTQYDSRKGGFIHYKAYSGLKELSIFNNIIKDVWTSDKGGALYVESKDLENLLLLSNRFTNIQTLNSDADGGVVYINVDEGINSIGINSVTGTDTNVFIDCYSKGSGGCIFANSGGLINTINITNNYFKNCTAGNGGGSFYFKSNANGLLTDSVKIIGNITGQNVVSQVEGEGGILHFESNSSIGKLAITDNVIQNLKATDNGGAFYFNLVNLEDFDYINNDCKNVKTNENGGVVYIQSAKDCNSVSISKTGSSNSNSFINCAASERGGCFYIEAEGLLGVLSVAETKFNNCIAPGGGGCLFLLTKELNTSISEQEIKLTNNNVKIIGQPSEFSGSGGFLFFESDGIVNILDVRSDTLADLKIDGSGGAIYLKSGSLLHGNINNNIFNNIQGDVTSQNIHGGAIYLELTEYAALDLNIDSNYFGNISGFYNGGAFNVNGHGVRDAYFAYNQWENISSKQSGGIVYLNNDSPLGELYIYSDSCILRNENAIDIPANGGGYYISGIDSVSFSDVSLINIQSSQKGGAIYMDNTSFVNINRNIITNCSSGSGGGIFVQGSNSDETINIENCRIFQNSAITGGGGIFISQFDKISIGDDNNGNVFSSNVCSPFNESKGGAIYLQNSESIITCENQIYGNNAVYGGGVYIDTADVIGLTKNLLVGNSAHVDGGGFCLKNVMTGVIENNTCQYNTTNNNGGALFIENSIDSNQDTIYVNDNYYFRNDAREGGAILANYPLNLKRNLFSRNRSLKMDPINKNFGSAVSLYKKGIQSIIYNCVFDKNFWEFSTEPLDGSLYFRESTEYEVPHDFSIQNCTFINEDQFKSIFSEENQIGVLNSLFKNEGGKNNRNQVYFNSNVTAHYCDLVFANNNNNNNFDLDVIFMDNCYYPDCNSSYQPLTDKGFRSSSRDEHMPPGCGNPEDIDVGVSGGIYNPESLCEFNDTLTVKLKVTQVCDTIILECQEDGWLYYHWFLPDGQVINTDINPYPLVMDLEPGLNYFKLLTETENPSRFGFGIYDLEIHILNVDSLVLVDPNIIQGQPVNIDTIPFFMTIQANITDRPQNYSYAWKILTENGLNVDTIDGSSSMYNIVVVLDSINVDSAIEKYFEIKYTGIDTKCNVVDYTILRVDLNIECTIPEISFETSEIACFDTIRVDFHQQVLALNGDSISGDNIADLYSLHNITANEPVPVEYFEIIPIHYPSSIVFHLDTNYLCDHIGDYIKLQIEGSKLMSLDCKLPLTNEFNEYIIKGLGGVDAQTFDIYPNPVSEKLFVRFDEPKSYYIFIYDILGKPLIIMQICDARSCNIDFSDYPQGIYIIQMVNYKTNEISSFRIIKTN